MSRFVKLLATVGTALCLVGGLHATGYFGPYIYLDDGGKNVQGSPEFTGASKCAEFLAIFILAKNWSSQKKRPKKTRRKNRRSGLRKPPTTQQKPISKILIRRCRRHGSSQPTRQKRKNSTNKLALRLMPLRAGRRRRCPPSLIPNLRPTTKAQPRI